MTRRAVTRLAWAAASIIALLLTASAPAGAQDESPEARFPAGGDAMRQALAMAQQHWNTPACGGNVALAWADMDISMNALASWSAREGAPPSQYTNCRIDFNRQVPYDWDRLCTVMLHEVGHLVGQQHSDDPGSPMSHEYLGPVGPCALGAEATAPPPLPTPAPRRATPRRRCAKPFRALRKRSTWLRMRARCARRRASPTVASQR